MLPLTRRTLTLLVPPLLLCGCFELPWDKPEDTGYADLDGDGWPVVHGDCDDLDPNVHPDAQEVCDDADVDENCDGLADDDDPTVLADGMLSGWLDADGDGWGGEVELLACDLPPEAVQRTGDCDDGDPAVHPEAQEVCDDEGTDEDCDGLVDDDDESLDPSSGGTWYPDSDGDGFGDAASPVTACEQPPDTLDEGLDCDDGDPAINPDAQEVCDDEGTDEDCDTWADDVDPSVSRDTRFAWYADTDRDGYGDPHNVTEACDLPAWHTDESLALDCDDGDPAVHPEAQEVCDADDADEDCDGLVDDDDDSVDSAGFATFRTDADGDGHGDAATAHERCDAGPGQVADATDCDDSDAAQHPGADELCNLEDDDCDGAIDEDDAADAPSWYLDSDADGWGDDATATPSCAQPSGMVLDPGDCDDGDPGVNPGAAEICGGADEDCDGLVDEDDPALADAGSWYDDLDGDGWGETSTAVVLCTQPSGTVPEPGDCDDADASAHPGGEELCDGADNDCDGTVDEGDASDATTWYVDADGDSFGETASATPACTQPSGAVADPGDCDDADPAINPAATETCNGVDDDCDGATDEDAAADVVTWYADVDEDGFGDAGSSDLDCEQPPGFVTDASDCDDTDPARHPDAAELCNGVDDDCDGTTDEDDASDASTWYADLDEDGFGDPGSGDLDCDRPPGFVADATDCDDTDATQHPGADERCNGEDDDCDGTTDEDDAVDAPTWYADLDEDGFGDAGSGDIDCVQPTGFVADATDCDDSDAAQHPGADELCNGEDDDCDGATDEDEAVDVATWYADTDGDGFGDASSSDIDCAQPTGFVADATDCDDTRTDVSPAGTEICDDLDTDEDCSGAADDADAGVDLSTARTWYLDSDGDGVGNAADGSEGPRCDPSPGYVAEDGDCDEGNPSVHALHDEICDGIDNDCDAGTGEAGVISVGASAYGDLASAVAAASAGAEITLCEGTHRANVTTAVPLTLRSLHGAGLTMLDGGGAGAIVTMGDDLTVDGLTFTGGAGVQGGAIDGSAAAGALLDIDGCILEGNEADSGGALYALELDLRITDTDLRDNTASVEGGALWVSGSGALDLESVLLYGNDAESGGGAYLAGVVAEGGVFFDNTASYGGGVYLDGATLQGAWIGENLASSRGGGVALDGGAALLGSEVTLNLATSGGGLSLWGGGCRTGAHPTTGVGTSVSDNEATVYGGGIVGVSVGTITLDDSSVTDNTAYYGGGLYLQTADRLEGTGLVVSGNIAPNNGGGLYLTGVGSIQLDALVLDGNQAGSTGGGGRIEDVASLALDGATVSDNVAGAQGGGLYLGDVSAAVLSDLLLVRNQGSGAQGGGIYLSSGVELDATGDFGVDGDDNQPDDFGMAGRGYSFTGWASCDSDLLSCSGG